MFSYLKAAIVPNCPPVLPDGTGGCGWAQFNELIQNVMNFLGVVSIPLAVVVIIYGGFLVMTAAGSEKRVDAGKQAILSAVVGLAIVFGSYIIITLILRAIS